MFHFPFRQSTINECFSKDSVEEIIKSFVIPFFLILQFPQEKFINSISIFSKPHSLHELICNMLFRKPRQEKKEMLGLVQCLRV